MSLRPSSEVKCSREMASVRETLSTLCRDAFEAHGLSEATGNVTVSDRPDIADYQCNDALRLAKTAKRKPRDIAEEIAAHLNEKQDVADVTVAGPGFLNFRLSDAFLTTALSATATDNRLGVPRDPTPQKVVIDFGGPNIAKPMHVGHLRSSVIGECLKRLLRFNGHDVMGDIHLGDWGKQMGMLIFGLSRERPELPYFDASISNGYPATPPITISDLEELYPRIAAECAEDSDVDAACIAATAELQAGRPGYRALWQHFVDISIAEMKVEFGSLDVTFDLWYGESRYQEMLAPLVEQLVSAGVAEKSEGAVIVRFDETQNKELSSPLVIQKSDGSFLYGTTDLATLRERLIDDHADTLVYVVDQRQGLHFAQVFDTARRAGIAGNDTELIHVGFGTVNGPDGKPFKTRAGGVMKLRDMIELLHVEARERVSERIRTDLGDDEKDRIALMVGIGALKFADLQHHRGQNYVFDLKKFVSFEGKTGPYIQYTAARIKSLLENAGAHANANSPLGVLSEDERAVMIHATTLPIAVAEASRLFAPHTLCEYIFQLAQKFNAVYQKYPILDGDNLRPGGQERLALAALCLAHIELVMSLLGIKIPERM